jgi:hypothetical protein
VAEERWFFRVEDIILDPTRLAELPALWTSDPTKASLEVPDQVSDH